MCRSAARRGLGMLAVALVVLVCLLVAGSSRPGAARAASCELAFGFAEIRAYVTMAESDDRVGDCVEPIAYDAEGDASQRTTNGTLVWRKADNLVAFTDGVSTWRLTADGLGKTSNVDDAPADLQATIGMVPGASYLFVLPARSGQLDPVLQKEATYALVLQGADKHVTVFSDRPYRHTYQQPLADFIGLWDEMGFVEVPPNAAIVLSDGRDDADVLVVALAKPVLDAGAGTVTFEAQVLADAGYSGASLAYFTSRADKAIPASFGAASLFIDSVGSGAKIVNGCKIEPRTECKRANLSGANLAGADLTGANLEDARLSNADLRNTNLTRATLTYAILNAARMDSANLSRATLRDADLRDARLSSADLSRAMIQGARMQNAVLSEATLSNGTFDETSFNRADLRGAMALRASMENVDLRNARLDRADFTRINLTGARMAQADLRGTTLSGAIMRGVDLKDAFLGGASLDDADLSYANLQGATLAAVNLDRAVLTGARYCRTHINGQLRNDHC